MYWADCALYNDGAQVILCSSAVELSKYCNAVQQAAGLSLDVGI